MYYLYFTVHVLLVLVSSILLKSGSDQMGQIQVFSDQMSIHFGSSCTEIWFEKVLDLGLIWRTFGTNLAQITKLSLYKYQVWIYWRFCQWNNTFYYYLYKDLIQNLGVLSNNTHALTSHNYIEKSTVISISYTKMIELSSCRGLQLKYKRRRTRSSMNDLDLRANSEVEVTDRTFFHLG